MAVVHIANHMARDLVFHKDIDPLKPEDPPRVGPGRTIALDAEHWKKIKNEPAIQGLLKLHAIEEVKEAFDEVPIGVEKTAFPKPPEHLTGEEHTGAQVGQKAKVIKAEKKEIVVPAKE